MWEISLLLGTLIGNSLPKHLPLLFSNPAWSCCTTPGDEPSPCADGDSFYPRFYPRLTLPTRESLRNTSVHPSAFSRLGRPDISFFPPLFLPEPSLYRPSRIDHNPRVNPAIINHTPLINAFPRRELPGIDPQRPHRGVPHTLRARRRWQRLSPASIQPMPRPLRQRRASPRAFSRAPAPGPGNGRRRSRAAPPPPPPPRGPLGRSYLPARAPPLPNPGFRVSVPDSRSTAAAAAPFKSNRPPRTRDDTLAPCRMAGPGSVQYGAPLCRTTWRRPLVAPLLPFRCLPRPALPQPR